MRTWSVVLFSVLSLTVFHVQPARAQSAALQVIAPSQAHSTPPLLSAAHFNVEAAQTSTAQQPPVGGSSAWLLAGLVGAIIPLFLFALPVLLFAWFGPFAPVAFLVGLVVAAVTTAAGGAVACAMFALFSNVRNGFVIPIVASALFGVTATFLGAALATVIIAGGLILSWFVSPYPDFRASAASWRNHWTAQNTPFLFGAGFLAFAVWGTAVLTAAFGGPLTAAYLFQHGQTAHE